MCVQAGGRLPEAPERGAKVLKESITKLVVSVPSPRPRTAPSVWPWSTEESSPQRPHREEKRTAQSFPCCSIEKVALHVARGLQYLHNEKKLLHGDMKSCNVVIKGDFETVKICDVGVSLQLEEKHERNNVILGDAADRLNMSLFSSVSDPKAEYIGTEPWKPKETLEEGGEISDKADIYAYGLTLWEMMTLAMPHLEMLEDDDEEDEEDSMEESFDEDAYYERLGTRPPLDTEALGGSYQRMVELFYLCTEENPKKRPSAAQIVQALESNAPLEKTPAEVIVID
ncbi:hypothetical protein INR49_022793 [Caranx melampygus]|nr:hypothetical protein INR49_022793 [Caranx melampygus]